VSRFSGSQSDGTAKDGRKNRGVLRRYRETKRAEAQARQAEFDLHYEANKKNFTRKELGDARHGERLAHPKVTTPATGLLTEVFGADS
jgi:hypothetical protein